MNDKTKKLFVAPWSVTDLDYVKDSEDYYICEAETREQANRIVRLPELYDALDKAAPYCPIWLTQEIVTLLQKVRDGE